MKTETDKPQHTQGEWISEKHSIGAYYGNIISKLGRGDDGIMNIRTIAIILKNCGEQEAEANAQRIVTCVNEYEALKKKADMHDELVESVKVQLDIIKNLIASKRVVNLDEAISYYEQLLKQAGQK